MSQDGAGRPHVEVNKNYGKDDSEKYGKISGGRLENKLLKSGKIGTDNGLKKSDKHTNTQDDKGDRMSFKNTG